MIETYNDLKDAVQRWLDDNEPEAVSEIPVFIHFAESELYRTLRIPPFEKFGQVTITNGHASLPPDILAFKQVFNNTFVDIKQTSIENVHKQSMSFARVANNLLFSKDFKTGDKVSFIYYAEPKFLKDSNQKNDLLGIAPDLLLYTTLRHACLFTQDDVNAQKFSMLAKTAYDSITRQAEEFEYSAGPIQLNLPKSVI